jgi:hypothetical protein
MRPHTDDTPIVFRHIVSDFYYPRTYAYKHPYGSNWVEVSAAYCSPKDQYCKKTGRELALKRFEEGHTMLMPWEQFKYDLAMMHKSA